MKRFGAIALLLALATPAPKPAMAQQAVRSGYQPQPDADGRLDMWVNWRQLTLRPRGV